ncbi:MAG: hypothetical protein IJT08_00560 [Alphaproteobacteria bacterium]|nr:hypothetical protein [Alphaproteobacteria bacterium]
MPYTILKSSPKGEVFYPSHVLAINLQLHLKEITLFSKRGEKKALICRAAVKPAGRSPESKPEGAAWLDGTRKGKSV